MKIKVLKKEKKKRTHHIEKKKKNHQYLHSGLSTPVFSTQLQMCRIEIRALFSVTPNGIFLIPSPSSPSLWSPTILCTRHSWYMATQNIDSIWSKKYSFKAILSNTKMANIYSKNICCNMKIKEIGPRKKNSHGCWQPCNEKRYTDI